LSIKERPSQDISLLRITRPPPDPYAKTQRPEAIIRIYYRWICPEYKVTAVEISPSNGPSEWQKAYDEQARHSRRIAPVVEAAE
jgi:hypothetical protein